MRTLGIAAAVFNGSGKPTNMFGIDIENQGESGITNTYGLRIKEQSLGTNNWNIYSEGATSRNYFAGSVGIGTSSLGSYKLNVDGKIRADEIVVNITGADFVFEEDYQDSSGSRRYPSGSIFKSDSIEGTPLLSICGSVVEIFTFRPVFCSSQVRLVTAVSSLIILDTLPVN